MKIRAKATEVRISMIRLMFVNEIKASSLITLRRRWPARMFARSRKPRVKGWAKRLAISVTIKAGTRKVGLPPGRNWQRSLRGSHERDAMKMVVQNVRATARAM